MCDDLQDLRAKITRRTHAALLAKSAATGRDLTVIVREVLDVWAADEVHAATIMARLLRREGLLGEIEGSAGGMSGEHGGKCP